MPSINGASHVALTVQDMERSAEWYQRVFGWQVLRRYGADEAELEAWTAHLDELGVARSPVRVLDLGRFVSFEDPDGIQLELWL